jgi:hypothetical protein
MTVIKALITDIRLLSFALPTLTSEIVKNTESIIPIGINAAGHNWSASSALSNSFAILVRKITILALARMPKMIKEIVVWNANFFLSSGDSRARK